MPHSDYNIRRIHNSHIESTSDIDPSINMHCKTIHHKTIHHNSSDCSNNVSHNVSHNTKKQYIKTILENKSKRHKSKTSGKTEKHHLSKSNKSDYMDTIEPTIRSIVTNVSDMYNKIIKTNIMYVKIFALYLLFKWLKFI